MTLYNLILEDTIIEDIPLSEAMEVAEMYAEVEARHNCNIRLFRLNTLSSGYEYRVIDGDTTRTVATIEVSEQKEG